jgi:translation elongation factor EF-Tu-like GTPase
MSEIIAKLAEGDPVLLVFLALATLLTLGYMVHCVCAVFEPADEIEDDELAERIETAIGDATRDLLDAPKAIETDTTVIASACHEQLERDREYREDADAVRYQPAAEHIGSSLHGWIEWSERQACESRVDLRKPD